MNSITCVIPCYNAERFIAEAIESVLSQTRSVDEVIVVDDCSTDKSSEIVRRYPVTLLSINRNGGHAAARNVGIQAATGDLIAWLDADDYWDANHCEVVCGLLDRFPEAAVAYSCVRRVGNRTSIWDGPAFAEPTDVFWHCVRMTIVPAMSAVTRRDAIVAVGGFDESIRVAPDFELWLRMARKYKFVSSTLCTSNYRWHDGQISCDPIKQHHAVFEVRWNIYRKICQSETGICADRFADAMLGAWDDILGRYYYARDWDKFHQALELRRYLPKSKTPRSCALMRRGMLPRWTFSLWDRLRLVA